MRIVPAIAAALLAASAPLPAQSNAPSPAPDYAKDSAWLCLPGRADSCSTPLATTALNADGYGATGPSAVAKGPPIDCFYVYPTVSNDQGMNSDLIAGREEKLAAEAQFARFASVCRPFAPIYRQMTVSSVAAYAAGVDISAAGLVAFRDVLAAWRNFLHTRSNGRPFVLVGHSQGSLMIQMLIAQAIENYPALARRMKLAIIPGYDVLVPTGRLVGGTFSKTPLCSRSGQSNCVMSWTSFREKNVPPPGAIFGHSDQPGMTVGCVNPALPGSRGWVKLDSYWFTRSSYAVAGGPIAWSTEGAPPTSYVRTEGLVSAKCINDGQRGYLWVHTNHASGDKRTDRVGGEVSVFGMFLPGWGMHLADMAIAQGDLVREISELGGRR